MASQLNAAHAQFASDQHHAEFKKDEHGFLSPAAVSVALALNYADDAPENTSLRTNNGMFSGESYADVASQSRNATDHSLDKTRAHFALDLLRVSSMQSEYCFLSPAAITVALALKYASDTGSTKL